MMEFIQPAAPAVLVAPMAYAAASEGVAGRISSSLAYTPYRETHQYPDSVGVLGLDGTIRQYEGLFNYYDKPWSPDGQ